MFDQLGGLQPWSPGKTVAIKLNMTGPPSDKLDAMPNQMTHWVHPAGHRFADLPARQSGSAPASGCLKAPPSAPSLSRNS